MLGCKSFHILGWAQNNGSRSDMSTEYTIATSQGEWSEDW